MNIYSNITVGAKSRKRIGFFIDALDQNFQSQVLEGISEMCSEKNLDLVIFSGALRFSQIEHYTKYDIVKDFIFQNEIDGLIILTGGITEHYPIPEIKKIIELLQPLPMVSIGMEIPEILSVIMDNSGGIKKLLDHIIQDHGLKRIAFLKGPAGHEEARIRFKTYKKILKQENISFNPDLVIDGSYFSENAGEQAISILFNRDKTQVDAIVAADDSIAVGALRALKKRNIKVPEDIALAGFDNQDKAETVLPSLTTVSQQFPLQGRKALEILVKKIDKKQVCAVTKISAALVQRNSCGCKNSNDFPENNNCIINNKRKTQQEGEGRFRLNLLSHQLLTTFNQTQLFHILYKQITSLKIKNCFIVLYTKKTEQDPFLLSSHWVKPKKVKLVLGIKDGIPLLEERQSITFKTDTLLPNNMLNTVERESSVFIPISFKDEHYGYAIFDYNPDIFIDLYETLITIIGNAIHGCLLMEKLEEGVIQKTNLFINIAHEMKTPLTIISSYLEKYLEIPDNLKDLFIVRQNVNKLKSDMENFLDNEKLDRGLIFYSHNEIVNFSQFLVDKALDFEELAKKENIKILISCPDKLYIKIDPAGVERIFNNLFDNAIRYNKTDGEVIVKVIPKKEQIHISFANTGMKIKKEHCQTIFDPYHQISHQKRSIQGIGMGLSIVRKIIQSAGGAINLFPDISKTIFKITLPSTSYPNTNNMVSTIKKRFIPEDIIKPKLIKVKFKPKNNTIFIVDDNVQMLSFLIENLNPLYNIFWAEDGEIALNLLSKIPKPDIILSDIMMDKMDGFQFISHLKQNNDYRSIPLLFITAKNNQAARLKGLELGAVDYILKPFIIEELQMKLKTLLDYKMMLQNSSKKEIEMELQKYFSNKIKLVKDRSKSTCADNTLKLTEKQQKIIKYIYTGKLYKEIACAMNISINTLKTHIYRIYKKCGINNKIELMNLNLQ